MDKYSIGLDLPDADEPKASICKITVMRGFEVVNNITIEEYSCFKELAKSVIVPFALGYRAKIMFDRNQRLVFLVFNELNELSLLCHAPMIKFCKYSDCRRANELGVTYTKSIKEYCDRFLKLIDYNKDYECSTRLALIQQLDSNNVCDELGFLKLENSYLKRRIKELENG